LKRHLPLCSRHSENAESTAKAAHSRYPLGRLTVSADTETVRAGPRGLHPLLLDADHVGAVFLIDHAAIGAQLQSGGVLGRLTVYGDAGAHLDPAWSNLLDRIGAGLGRDAAATGATAHGRAAVSVHAVADDHHHIALDDPVGGIVETGRDRGRGLRCAVEASRALLGLTEALGIGGGEACSGNSGSDGCGECFADGHGSLLGTWVAVDEPNLPEDSPHRCELAHTLKKSLLRPRHPPAHHRRLIAGYGLAAARSTPSWRSSGGNLAPQMLIQVDVL